MTALFNWRIWAAVILCLAQAAFGWKMYKIGGNSVQVAFDTYKNKQVLDTLAAERAARAKEQSLQVANTKVSQNYESLKTATAVAVGALDADRLRLQAALADRSVPGDPGASPSADANPEVRILSECLARYAAMAGDADHTSDTLKSLQDYVRSVVKPAQPDAPQHP